MIKVTAFSPGNVTLHDKNMIITGGAAIHGMKKRLTIGYVSGSTLTGLSSLLPST